MTDKPNSRDIIIATLRKELNIPQPEAEGRFITDEAANLADVIIQALAAEHLHIFKSKGSEL